MRLRHATFPLSVGDAATIEAVAALKAANLINAVIPAPSQDRANFGAQPPATVTGLTRLGQLEIARREKLPKRRQPPGHN